MKDRTDKNKLAELERQQAADRAAQQAALAAATAPKPVETALETEQTNWLADTSGKNGPIDIATMRGMGPSVNLYQGAAQRQQGERMGRGLIQMGAQNTNPGLGALLRQQSDDQRQQEAAGGLEAAYRMKDAEMRGSIMPLLGLQQQRTMGLAGLTSNQSQNSTNQWTNFRPAPSIWSNLLMAGIQGAAGVGAGMATGGTGFFKK
jgi:hypothetical protein